MNIDGKECAGILMVVYWAIWVYYVKRTNALSRRLRQFYGNQGRSVGDPSKIAGQGELVFSGTRIRLRESDIVVRTTVNLVGRGTDSIVEDLNRSNFRIVEQYDSMTRKPRILSVRPASSTMWVVIVIDTGVTMLESCGIGMTSKLTIARQAVNLFLDRFLKKENAHVSVMRCYGEYINSSDYVTKANQSIWFDRQEREDLKQAIDDNLRAQGHSHGNTPLWAAIGSAQTRLSRVSDNGAKAVIVLTDGQRIGGNIARDELSDRLVAPVFFLCYGRHSSSHRHGMAELSRLSGAGGENLGTFTGLHPGELAHRMIRVGAGLANAVEICWVRQVGLRQREVTARIQAVCHLHGHRYLGQETCSYIA